MAIQVPIGPDLMPEQGNRVVDSVALSLESQLKLRELYQYMDTCRTGLKEIQANLALGELQRVSEKLEGFCCEADTWGFSALHEVAVGLQMLLLNANGNIRTNGFHDALLRGLTMLSALLEQCERDYYWRLAIADTLDCFESVRSV